MDNIYLWYKALHTIALIAWMAGMLYLPRLFVYHAQAKIGSESSETFKIMEKRLLRFITTPAMLITVILGILLIARDPSYYLSSGWLHAKLLFVFIMIGMHGYFAKTVRVFAQDKNLKTAKFYKIINEVPTILMILIIILVVVKPI